MDKQIIQKLESLLTNCYKWYNLPEGLNGQLLEQMLLHGVVEIKGEKTNE